MTNSFHVTSHRAALIIAVVSLLLGCTYEAAPDPQATFSIQFPRILTRSEIVEVVAPIARTYGITSHSKKPTAKVVLNSETVMLTFVNWRHSYINLLNNMHWYCFDVRIHHKDGAAVAIEIKQRIVDSFLSDKRYQGSKVFDGPDCIDPISAI